MRFSLAWSIHQKGYPGVEAPVWIRIPSNIKFCSVNQELICQLSRLISPLSPESHPVSPVCPCPRNYSSVPSKHAGTSTAATWGILQPKPALFKGSCSHLFDAEPLLSRGLCSTVVPWYSKSELSWVLRVTQYFKKWSLLLTQPTIYLKTRLSSWNYGCIKGEYNLGNADYKGISNSYF